MFSSNSQMAYVCTVYCRTLEFKHDTGKLSQVHIAIAGMEMRKVRIANLPPEVPDYTIRDNLAKYGEVKDIKEELWARAYRYKVS